MAGSTDLTERARRPFWRLGDRLTLLGQGGTTWYPGTNTQWSWSAAASVRIHLLESVGISLEGRALPEAIEAAIRLHWFY